MKVDLVVMTCDKSDWTLKGFFHTLRKRCKKKPENVLVYGYRNVEVPDWAEFVSIGNFDQYPANKWSDSLHWVLSDLQKREIEVFWLMLDDYWIVRDVDTNAVNMLVGYMHQFKNVLKIDLCTDRLFASGGGQYLYNNNTYGYCGYLDLLKSVPGSPYHMSFWGGLWRTDLLKNFVITGEGAQQMEIAGTHRVSAVGDEVLVLGTRQAPLLHTNILQGGKSPNYVQPFEIDSGTMEELRKQGALR